jgi:hypothetical protein
MTDSEPRPEVIDALFDALYTMDPAKLHRAAELGATPTERQRADELFLASKLAAQDHRARTIEAWGVLIARQWSSPPTWEQLFDDLTPDRAARLRDLYDALPDGARAEYDRRYGPPEGGA